MAALDPGDRMRMLLEVVVVPVSDVDRAKAFYAEALGFAVDHDTTEDPDGNGWAVQQISSRG